MTVIALLLLVGAAWGSDGYWIPFEWRADREIGADATGFADAQSVILDADSLEIISVHPAEYLLYQVEIPGNCWLTIEGRDSGVEITGVDTLFIADNTSILTLKNMQIVQMEDTGGSLFYCHDIRFEECDIYYYYMTFNDVQAKNCTFTHLNSATGDSLVVQGAGTFTGCDWTSATMQVSGSADISGGQLLNASVHYSGLATGNVLGLTMRNTAQNALTIGDSTTVNVQGCTALMGDAYVIYADSACVLSIIGNNFTVNSATASCFYYNGTNRISHGGNIVWNNGIGHTYDIYTRGTVYQATNIGNNIHFLKGTLPTIWQYGWNLMQGEWLGGVTDTTVQKAVWTTQRDVPNVLGNEGVWFESANTPSWDSGCKQADSLTHKGPFWHIVGYNTGEEEQQLALYGSDGYIYGPKSIEVTFNDPDSLDGSTFIFWENTYPDTFYVTKTRVKAQDASCLAIMNLYYNKRASSVRLDSLIIATDSTAFYYFEADSSVMDKYIVPPHGEVGLVFGTLGVRTLTLILDGTYIKKYEE